ncbi:hypothetical protein OZX74_08820 [Bifidobacterium sp. ESL0798]|uniref:hypothetical protein n=1 Tax=Bifidobacterium sp. ESL0798 TaxID=2983235 RepID=UPI0023F95D7C|nr:hypothetical protein [Bifidobacterium sp. ESL0798]WEV73963.1 hypothetical protein OZX74_08820 [Bifidobacterium sp. ESL0798]
MTNFWDQATAEADQLWNGMKKGCEQAGADAQAMLNGCLKQAETGIIKDVVAPWHASLASIDVNRNERDKNAFLHSVADDWSSYADNVDSSAQGAWATQAKQTMQDEAAKVRPE